jgi:hypothetical protein
MATDEYAAAAVEFDNAFDQAGPPPTQQQKLDRLKERLMGELRGRACIDTVEGRKLVHLCAREGFVVRVEAWVWYSGRTVQRSGVPVFPSGKPRGYSDLSPDGTRVNYPHLHRYDPKAEWLEEGEYIIIQQVRDGEAEFRRFKAYEGIEPPCVVGIFLQGGDIPDDDTLPIEGAPESDSDFEPPVPEQDSQGSGPESEGGEPPPSSPSPPPRRSTRVRRAPARFTPDPDGAGPAEPYNPAEPPEVEHAIEVAQSIASRLSRVRRPPARYGR